MSTKKLSVIAMKGPPYTFKSTAASTISKFLLCPVLCADDILDGLFQHHHGASSLIPSPEEAERLSLLALDLICQIAKSFFQQGIFSTIIIDSRLSSPAQVEQLIKWAATSSCNISSVLIIECKPKNAYTWEMRFEETAVDRVNWYDEHGKWYKPKNWEDIEKANMHDFDCNVDSLRSDSFRVSKLVLDPFTALQFLDISEPKKTPLFVEAVFHLIFLDKDEEGPLVLDFDKWRVQSRPSSSIIGRKTTGFCRHGHSITEYMEEGVMFTDNCVCKACEKPITVGAAYACDTCQLVLHKACAEFDRPLNISFRTDGRLIESFKEYHMCSSCVKEGRRKDPWRCQSCLFESNLKIRLLPTIVNHKAHKHFLVLDFMPEESFSPLIDVGFQCMGCGHYVKDRVRYYCKLCGFQFELNCVHLPYRPMDEHGGYNHQMRLEFFSKEAEDYCCHRCLDKRDPRCWYYSCQQCVFDTHLRCTNDEDGVSLVSRWTPRPAIPFQQTKDDGLFKGGFSYRP